MASIAISGRIEVPVAALWARIADFADLSWVPGIRPLGVRGSGPGMVRVVAMGNAPALEERLERIDTGARWLEYTARSLQDDGSVERAFAREAPRAFPLRGYRGRMQVEPDADGSLYHWSVQFEPDGVSEDEAIHLVAKLGALLFRWLKRDLESKARR